MNEHSTSRIYSSLKSRWNHNRSKSKKYAINEQEAPILRLPTEVLVEIFTIVAREDDFREKPTSNLRICEMLARTCSHFRAIILAMPDAWSTIDVSIDSSPSSLSRYLETGLQKAKGSPLRIVVRDGSRLVKADLLKVIARALRNTNVKKIESVSFFLRRADMAYFPQLFMDLLPIPPHSLTIHALPSPSTHGLFKKSKRSSVKAFFIPAGRAILAVESIQVIDAVLNIGVNAYDRAPMALRSLRVLQSSKEEFPIMPSGIMAGGFLGRCVHLETLVFYGRFFWSERLETPVASSLKELYIADFDSDDILHCLSKDMSFPNLTKFGVAAYKPSILHPFLLSLQSVTEIQLPFVTPEMAPVLSQITKLTIASAGLPSLSSLLASDALTSIALEKLVIDCQRGDMSREDLKTLMNAPALSFNGGDNEQSSLSVFLWRPSTSETMTSRPWTSSWEGDGDLPRVSGP